MALSRPEIRRDVLREFKNRGYKWRPIDCNLHNTYMVQQSKKTGLKSRVMWSFLGLPNPKCFRNDDDRVGYKEAY